MLLSVFPWKEDETDFDPEKAVAELGETALLTFREGYEVDSEGKPTGTTAEKVILTGSDVEKASVRLGRKQSICGFIGTERVRRYRFFRSNRTPGRDRYSDFHLDG